MAQRLAPTESSRAEGTLTLQEEGGAQKQSGAAAGGTPSPGLHRRGDRFTRAGPSWPETGVTPGHPEVSGARRDGWSESPELRATAGLRFLSQVQKLINIPRLPSRETKLCQEAYY